MQEISLALDWAQAHAERLGVGGPVLLAGWSAGATLALLNAGHAWVDGVMGISGIYELAPLRDTRMNAQLRLDDDDIERFSPLRHPPPRKPISLAVGANELPALAINSEAMAAHTGIPLHTVSQADHFSVLEALAEPDGELVERALALFS